MKISEHTADRLSITSRRSPLIDAGLLVVASLGLVFAFGAVNGAPSLDRSIMLVIALGFAAFGIWGLWQNGSANVTFDARRQCALFAWRRLKGVERVEIPFSDLADVRVHEDDNMHTLEFRLTSGKPILFERAFSGNPGAYDVAEEVRNWLTRARSTSCAT